MAKSSSRLLATVHPRVHGEDDVYHSCDGWVHGSPPCARGRLGSRGRRSSGPAVHPRVHGEDAMPSRERLSMAGSPPCARGRHRRIAVTGLHLRFTPVCTGKTQGFSKSFRPVPVHPRVHGEDDPASALPRGPPGSPPCARGRPRRRSSRAGLTAVHPRVHGEDYTVTRTIDRHRGSPPCARGRHWKSTAFSWFWPAKGPRSPRTPPVTCHERESRTPAPCLPRTKARPNRP